MSKHGSIRQHTRGSRDDETIMKSTTQSNVAGHHSKSDENSKWTKQQSTVSMIWLSQNSMMSDTVWSDLVTKVLAMQRTDGWLILALTYSIVDPQGP